MSNRALEQSWRKVRRLAEKHPGEWLGQDLDGDEGLRFYAGAGVPRRVLVTTKAPALWRWPRPDWPSGLVCVAAVGNITRPQAAIIEKLASDGSVPIPFVGDADPMALHTYASLRVHLGARRVRFAGMCDAVLDAIGEDDVRAHTLHTVEMSAFDRAHLRVVEGLLKPERVLGPKVSAVLRQGKQILLEAIGFRAGLVNALFEAALEVAGHGRRSVLRAGGPSRPPRRDDHGLPHPREASGAPEVQADEARFREHGRQRAP